MLNPLCYVQKKIFAYYLFELSQAVCTDVKICHSVCDIFVDVILIYWTSYPFTEIWRCFYTKYGDFAVNLSTNPPLWLSTFWITVFIRIQPKNTASSSKIWKTRWLCISKSHAIQWVFQLSEQNTKIQNGSWHLTLTCISCKKCRILSLCACAKWCSWKSCIVKIFAYVWTRGKRSVIYSLCI